MGLEVEVVGETNKFDVIVIGGGVAGITASSAVTQEGLKSCFLERDVPGGKLMRLETINNFEPAPGIKGPTLGTALFNQATEDIKTHYAYGNVQAIRPKNDLFYLFTEDGQTWEAKALIICVGTINKKLNVEGEDKFFNKGISYCAICDGALAKGKKVVLVGQTTHIDFLKQYASDVVVLKPTEVKEIKGSSTVSSVIKTNGTIINCDYVFIENGYEYKTDFLPSEIELSDEGEVLVDANQKTNFTGVYAAGDCTNSKVKLITAAMQQASVAAKQAVEYIKSRKW